MWADPLPSGADPEIDEDPTAEPDPQANWRILYLDCLLCEILLTNKTKARHHARRAKSFTIVNGEIYKKSHTKILQRCIPTKHGRNLLEDIHSGVCGHHVSPRTLVEKDFQQGFYWPIVVADTNQVARTYEGCQYYAR
jgi:hypothetical protein